MEPTHVIFLSQVPVTAASLNPDGKMVVAGGQGGSLHLLPLSSYAGKSDVVDDAHGWVFLSCLCILFTPKKWFVQLELPVILPKVWSCNSSSLPR